MCRVACFDQVVENDLSHMFDKGAILSATIQGEAFASLGDGA